MYYYTKRYFKLLGHVLTSQITFQDYSEMYYNTKSYSQSVSKVQGRKSIQGPFKQRASIVVEHRQPWLECNL